MDGQAKDEIETKGDLPQKCEFYDVRNLVHSVTSEPFVVQRKFSSQSAKQKIFLLVFLRKEETMQKSHDILGLILQQTRRHKHI